MKNLVHSASLLAITLLVLLFAGSAQAQATRTWVSGVGDDVNPCSRTAPCKTWAGAISKTAAGGEIDALDPGGFGAVTITKAITIDGGGGQVASTLVAGTNGFVVAAQPGDLVIIRNMRLNGLGQTPTPGLAGIRFQSGAQLSVENCFIFGFTTAGIQMVTTQASRMNVSDTAIKNTVGSGSGIIVAPGAGGSANVELERVIMDSNAQNGLKADSTSGAVNVAMADSDASNNGNDGVLVTGTSSGATVNIRNSTFLANAANGVEASGAAATVIVGSSTFVANNRAGLNGGGFVGSYSNNQSNGNALDNGTFTGTGFH